MIGGGYGVQGDDATRKSDPAKLLAGREPVGDLLNPDPSLGNIQDELKGVVVIEIDSLTVHVQEDCGCQPAQTLVAINQGMVRHDRMQQRSRFEFDSRIGVLTEGTRLGSGNASNSPRSLTGPMPIRRTRPRRSSRVRYSIPFT